MKEIILNKYLKIEPIHYESVMVSNKESYEEIGVVVGKDPTITDIPIGAKVYFDSFMAKKYPKPKSKEFQWFVAYSEIVKCDVE